MRRKQVNIIGFIIAVLLMPSCSAIKRAGTGGRAVNGTYDSRKFFGEVQNQNITNNSFRFDKVKVDAKINGERLRFSGNLRYSKEGRILFSARTIGNIEVARIYIDRENYILVDRINRSYNRGTTATFLKKYGLSWDDLIVVFGDYPASFQVGGRLKCKEGIAETSSKVGERMAIFQFDCSNMKMKEIKIIADSFSGESFNATYGDIRKEEDAVYPGIMSVDGSKGNFDVEVSFDRYRTFEGKISPPSVPSGYDIINMK